MRILVSYKFRGSLSSIQYLLVVFLFLTGNISITIAQERIDQKGLEELVEELDYSTTKKVWKLKKFETQKKAPLIKQIDGLDAVMKIIGYLLLGLIIIGIIYVIIRDLKPKVSLDPLDVNIDNIQDIETVNFELLLAQALERKDYRLALRLKFLNILKVLTQTKKIRWKPYKTNRVYVSELHKNKPDLDLRQLADIFEYTWYGVATISQLQYKRFETDYDSFLKKLEG